jgi:hypothetical protein
MKRILVFAWLTFLAIGAAALFWYNEWQYSLPTPVPQNYHSVSFGQLIKPDAKLTFPNNKPVFLHFFNPDCPCSRFNIAHFKSLVKAYGNRVNFAVVLLTDKYCTAKSIQKKFDLDVPVVVDPAVALQCGVYSTPQAALINTDHKLYFRGNYNQSRYCTNEKTEYAKIALNGMLQHNASLKFDEFALKAYGCRLPNCNL